MADELAAAVIAEAATDPAETHSDAAVEIAAIEAEAAVAINETNAEAAVAIAEAHAEASTQDDEQWLRDLFAEFRNQLLDDWRTLLNPILTSLETMASNLSILTTPVEPGEPPLMTEQEAALVAMETPLDVAVVLPAPETETAQSEPARRARRLM